MPSNPATDIDQGGDILSTPYAPRDTSPDQGVGLGAQQDQQDYRDRAAGLPTPGYTPSYTPSYTPTRQPGISVAQLQAKPEVPEWQPGGTFRAYDFGTTEEAPKGKGSFLGDMVGTLENSLAELGSSAVGFGRMVNTYTATSPWADEIMSGAQDALAGYVKRNTAGMGPARQMAAKASILRTFGLGPTTDENGEAIPGVFENGFGTFADYVAQRAVSFIPYGVAMVIPGMGEAATAALFGAQSMGDAYTALAKGLAGRPDAKYQQDNPVYRQLRTPVAEGGQGLSEPAAKQEMLKGSATSFLAIAGAGAIGAGAGALGKYTLGSGGVGALAGKAWSPSMQRLVGAVEGAGVGAAYSGGTSLATQAGEKGLGLRPDIDVQEALREALTGAVGGAVLGGVFGGKHPEEAAKPAVEDDEAAAMAATKPAGEPPPPPPGPSGPTGPPSSADMSGVPGWSPAAEPQVIPRTPAPAPAPPPVAAGEPSGIPGWSPPPPEGAPPAGHPVEGGIPASMPPAAAQAATTSKAKAAAPAPTDTTGMAGMGGGMAEAISGNLRDMLWDKLQKGDTTELGKPSRILIAAKQAADAGQIKTKADFDQFTQDFYKQLRTGKAAPEPAAAKPLTRGDVAMNEWPSQTTPVEQQRDELVTRFGEPPGKVKALSDNAIGTAYDRQVWAERARQPTPDVTTVVDSGPVTGVAAAAERPGELSPAASPPPSAEVGSLPVAAGARSLAAREGEYPATRAGAYVEGAGEGTREEAQAEAQRVALPADEHAAARERMAEAVPGMVHELVEVRPGAKLPPAVRSMIDAIVERVRGSKGGPEDLAQLLEKYREGLPTAPFAGTKTSPQWMLRQVIDRLAGRKTRAPEETAAIREVRAEEQAREGAESKTITPEAIEEKATAAPVAREEGQGEGSEGLTMGLTPVEKKARAATTTDIERKFNDLLEKVHEGTMTPAEAERAYADVPGRRGPPRREGYKTFADALRTRIAEGDDESRLQAIVKRMTEVNEDKDLSPQAKRKQLDALRREMDRETDPETVDKLRGYLERLEDPVGHAAREAEGEGGPLRLAMRVGRAIADGINPLSSRFVRMSRDPRIHASLVRAMQASEDHGVPFTLHDALKLIQRDSLVRAEMQPFHALTNRLLRLAPDMPVYSAEQAHARGLIDDDTLADFQAGGLYGHADINHPTEPHIVVNINQPNLHATHVETVLHEAMHTVTARYIAHLQETNPNHPDLLALRAIGDELGRAASENRDTLSETDRDLVNAARSFATMQPHETHTMLMTNPTIQALAASRIASPEFRARMAELGFPAREQGRSVWRYFTDVVRRALGMRAPASASEYTMLDHAMRVTEDITDRAAAYNERYLPKDPVLRSSAEPLYQTTAFNFSPRAQEVRDHIMDHLDAAGLGALARKGGLQAIPTHGIQRVWGRLFDNRETDPVRAAQRGGKPFMRTNPFDDYVEQSRNITRAGMDVRDADGDTVRAFSKAFDNSKNKTELGELINEVGYKKAYAGGNIPVGEKADPALQARYDKLAPADKATFDGMQQLHEKWGKAEQDAEVARMFNQSIPDATDAERNAVAKAFDTRKSIAAFRSDPDNSAVAKAFGAARWNDNSDFMRALAKFHEDGFVRGTYFPLRREGNWVVSHGDPDTSAYTVKMFTSRTAAERYRREQLAANTENVSQVGSKAEYTGSDLALNHPAVSDLYNRIISKPGFDKTKAEEVRRTLNEILLQRSSRQSQYASEMERRGIRGASTQHGTILNQELVNHAMRLGHMRYGAARQDAVSDMKKVASWLEHYGAKGDGIAARQVAEELEKRAAAIDDYHDPLASVLGKVNAWSFVKQLLSPSHWITSTMEAHTMALPRLAADIGGVTGDFQAAAAMANNMRRLAWTATKLNASGTMRAALGSLKAGNWSLNKDLASTFRVKGDTRLVDGLEQMFHQTGMIDHSYSADLYRQAQGKGILGGHAAALAEHMMAMSTYGQHVFDASNKWVIGKTAADTYLRRNPNDIRGAIDYARKVVEDSMPDYSPWNKARIATRQGVLKAFGPNAMQFKNYGFFLYSRLGAMVHDVAYGPDRARAVRALAGTLAYHALTAGAVGLVADPLRYALGAWDWASGADKPHDYQVNARQALASWLGPTWGELVGTGMTHALGIDVQHRVGIMNATEMPELSAFSEQAYSDLLAKALFGAAGDTLASTAGGVTKLFKGDVMGGLQDMAPRPIRDLMKAYRLTTEGVTAGGKQVLPPSAVPMSQVITQALGFQPAVKEEALMGRHAGQQLDEENKSARTHLSQRWLQADPTDRPAIMSEIRQFNQDPAHQGYTITTQMLLQDLNRQRKQANAPFGLRTPAKAAAAIARAGAFANVPRGAQVGAP